MARRTMRVTCNQIRTPAEQSGNESHGPRHTLQDVNSLTGGRLAAELKPRASTTVDIYYHAHGPRSSKIRQIPDFPKPASSLRHDTAAGPDYLRSATTACRSVQRRRHRDIVGVESRGLFQPPSQTAWALGRASAEAGKLPSATMRELIRARERRARDSRRRREKGQKVLIGRSLATGGTAKATTTAATGEPIMASSTKSSRRAGPSVPHRP